MAEAATADRSGTWSKQYVIGSLFWLCVLLALEPGNLLRWHGMPPSWSQETLRLGMASLLGGSCGPAIFWLVRSGPVCSGRIGRGMARHMAAIGILSLVLLTLANVLAWMFLAGPGPRHLPQEVAANFTLLVAGLAVLDFGVHLTAPKRCEPGNVSHITVKARTGTFQLPLVQVERLEAQENYVALHTATESHLVRMTLSSLVAELDPAQFARVHRSVIVNRGCIEKIKPIGNGKLQLTLLSGAEVIASRAYSAGLRGLWDGRL